jgi:hypothetical protein
MAGLCVRANGHMSSPKQRERGRERERQRERQREEHIQRSKDFH